MTTTTTTTMPHHLETIEPFEFDVNERHVFDRRAFPDLFAAVDQYEGACADAPTGWPGGEIELSCARALARELAAAKREAYVVEVQPPLGHWSAPTTYLLLSRELMRGPASAVVEALAAFAEVIA